MINFIQWLLSRKESATKVGGAIGGASGILFILFSLVSDVKLEARQEIRLAEGRSKEYVRQREEVIKIELNHLKEGQKEIKKYLEYLIKKDNQ